MILRVTSWSLIAVLGAGGLLLGSLSLASSAITAARLPPALLGNFCAFRRYCGAAMLFRVCFARAPVIRQAPCWR